MIAGLYFNPRSHEGSDNLYTRHYRYIRNFNPRSHEGSDAGVENCCSLCKYFNPRSHEGSDLYAEKCELKHKIISILAPTRGATQGYLNRL